MLIHGNCHCGNISFDLRWEQDAQMIPARACTCSFCTRHGGVWTSDPAGALVVRIADREHVSTYSFGTETAEFHVCARCGVVPLVTSWIDDRIYAVVNVNTFSNLDRSRVQSTPVTLEDEQVPSRLARRKRNWIALVQFADAADGARVES